MILSWRYHWPCESALVILIVVIVCCYGYFATIYINQQQLQRGKNPVIIKNLKCPIKSIDAWYSNVTVTVIGSVQKPDNNHSIHIVNNSLLSAYLQCYRSSWVWISSANHLRVIISKDYVHEPPYPLFNIAQRPSFAYYRHVLYGFMVIGNS